MEDMKYWVALNRVPQLGTVRFRRLESYFGELEHAWNAGQSELKAAGLEDRPAREVVAARGRISPDVEMESLERAGVTALNWPHADYPARLKEIADPPPVLYYKGTLFPSDERAVAVVGTRGPTAYGREVAAVLTADLARNDITIISGLARGVDGIAHRSALANGGRTIALLAGGLDSVYPREHTGLFQEIQHHGAVASEYPLGVRPDARNFPRRNRLISGMSLGTLVVEAGATSGARWTVIHALEQDREVFCVPGSIFSSNSQLTNRMIQEGAKLVSTYTDILEELNLTSVSHQIPVNQQIALPLEQEDGDAEPLGPEAALLHHLNDEPIHIDDIHRNANLPIASVSGLLTMLEMKGMVRQVGCMHYVRVREAAPVYGN
ncbi:MAG: DNA protecting protein DprA [SAR202 cluster bacterium Io17-Chloro-G9]|nr:MAG: DNA protecting protein DprA [SAR202 cluster bacterium Io17-Chloro-G9]